MSSALGSLDAIAESIVLIGVNASPIKVDQQDLPPQYKTLVSFNPLTAINYLPSHRIGCLTPCPFVAKIDKLYSERLEQYKESLEGCFYLFQKNFEKSTYCKLLENIQMGSNIVAITTFFLSLVSGGAWVPITWASLGLAGNQVTQVIVGRSLHNKINSIPLETAASIYGNEFLHGLEIIGEANLALQEMTIKESERSQITAIKDYFFTMTQEAVKQMNINGAKEGISQHLDSADAPPHIDINPTASTTIQITSYNPITLLMNRPSQRINCKNPRLFLQRLDDQFSKRILQYKKDLIEAVQIDGNTINNVAKPILEHNIKVAYTIGLYTSYFVSLANGGTPGSLILATLCACGGGFSIGIMQTYSQMNTDKTALIQTLAEIYGNEMLIALQIIKDAGEEISKLQKQIKEASSLQKITLEAELTQVNLVKDHFMKLVQDAIKEMSIKGAVQGIYETLGISEPTSFALEKRKELLIQDQFVNQVLSNHRRKDDKRT